MSPLPVAGFAPIALAEIQADAALQTRFDRKYALTREQATEALRRLDPRTRVLTIDGRRSFRYESVYFDSPDLVSYRQTAHGRRHRFKVRTRRYLDAGDAFLEVKVRGTRGVTTKDRVPYDPVDADHLTVGGWDYVERTLAGHGLDGSLACALRPTLTTRYRRVTLVPPEPGVRMTVDTDLTWDDGDRELTVPDLVLVETKSGPRPCGVDHLLWDAGHRPVSISKYATGLAALRELPANRWARVLRRHFTEEASCAA